MPSATMRAGVAEWAGDERVPGHLERGDPVGPGRSASHPARGRTPRGTTGGRRHEPVRLHPPLAAPPVMGPVREERALVVVTRLGQQDQPLGRDDLGWRHQRHGGMPQDSELGPQARGEEPGRAWLGRSARCAQYPVRRHRPRDPPPRRSPWPRRPRTTWAARPSHLPGDTPRPRPGLPSIW